MSSKDVLILILDRKNPWVKLCITLHFFFLVMLLKNLKQDSKIDFIRIFSLRKTRNS